MTFRGFDEQPAYKRRGRVRLQALLFTPMFMVFGGLTVYAISNILAGDTGYVVMLFVMGTLATMMGYQAIVFLRDVGAEPVTVEGDVAKKWTKGNLFFFLMPGFYVACQGKIYSIDRKEYGKLLELDKVRILYYPHSLTVEKLERYDDHQQRWLEPASEDDDLDALAKRPEQRRF